MGCLYFEFDCLKAQFVSLVRRICGARAYFHPNSAAFAKIRLIRISAENMIQPADFF